MNVAIASDHAGFALKSELAGALKARGAPLTVDDLGTFSLESVDYPDFAALVASAVVSGKARFGVLICGTGIGMSMVANKVRGVRAALCTSEFEARMARAHNDANVICLGQRVVGAGVALAALEAFLTTAFEGGRHERRVKMINDGERA